MISLEDHEWKLKLWDQDDKYVVVLHCSKCSKDFGGKSGEHSKDKVTNLFSNFQICIMSVQHICNWCQWKGVDWCHHHQSATRGKAMILTARDHKQLIHERIIITETINEGVASNQQLFLLVGDLDAEDVQCFWFKLKCTYCANCFQLCLPKKTCWRI